ncbi:hypothetical protein Mgra_00005366 [Meloidogyne graminicola]|uniref:Uncharacterized protein n=1 Tax=Meloidogyne graminicola TaxID=189291 RepID=A0A8S9ZP96_9BILA|nr:hypothetical protein Mgra_00005366 [Meloidogyne graminicola]
MRHCRAKISFVLLQLLFIIFFFVAKYLATPLHPIPSSSSHNSFPKLIPSINLETKYLNKIIKASSHSPIYHPAITSIKTKTLPSPLMDNNNIGNNYLPLKEKKEIKNLIKNKEKVYFPLNEAIGNLNLEVKEKSPQIEVEIEGNGKGQQYYIIRKAEKSEDLVRLYYLINYYLPKENKNLIEKIIWELHFGQIKALIAVRTSKESHQHEYGIEGYLLYNCAASSTRGKVSKQINNEILPNIVWTCNEKNNKIEKILKELIPNIEIEKRELWRLDLSAFKQILNEAEDVNILINEQIKVEETEQIVSDWNKLVLNNNGRPSSPELNNLLNDGRKGGICALHANIILTNKLVGMSLFNCDAYSGSSGKYIWLDRLIIDNNLIGKLNGKETIIALLAKLVEIAEGMDAERIEWTDDSKELVNYGNLLNSLGAVNLKEINGEILNHWDVNKYYLIKKEEKIKIKKEGFIPNYS